jgi:hypothetical protein
VVSWFALPCGELVACYHSVVQRHSVWRKHVDVRFLSLVQPCDTTLRSHECLALLPIVGEVEREPAKRNAETASTAGRTGLLPNWWTLTHRYRWDECNSELCCAPVRSPSASPALIIVLRLVFLASWNCNIQFRTLFWQQIFRSVKAKCLLLVLCCTVRTDYFMIHSFTVL